MPSKWTRPKRAEARRSDTAKGKGKKPAVAAEQLRRGKEAK